jgi:hypothetical protein
MSAEFLMRAALQMVSLFFGGSGIFFLWASFYAPRTAIFALLCLPLATGITLALPKTA